MKELKIEVLSSTEQSMRDEIAMHLISRLNIAEPYELDGLHDKVWDTVDKIMLRRRTVKVDDKQEK